MEEKARRVRGIWIPIEIWESKKLSAVDRLILAEIDSLDNGPDRCYASNKYFAEFLNVSERTVSRSIKKLCSMCYIRLVYTDEKGYRHLGSNIKMCIDNSPEDKNDGVDKTSTGDGQNGDTPATNCQRIKPSSPKEEHLNKNLESSKHSNRIEYEGMNITDEQYSDIERLINAMNSHKIDSCKGNIINYCKKLYDSETGEFKKQSGEVIRSLYGYIKSTFAIKTERDKTADVDEGNNPSDGLSLPDYFNFEI